MASNQHVNKVVYDGTTLVDLTSDTVTASTLMQGYTAHDASGSQITGSYVPPTFSTQAKSVAPSTVQQTVVPDSGYNGLSSVTVSAMPSGTAGTPTASAGTVANHSVDVTPSVTNTAGYISGGTKTGTALTISASDLVSGTLEITSGGTHDVTNYASATVEAGTTGTPTATKSSVSNHSVTVTPSVTNATGYITGGTKTGTAVTVTASELASGNLALSANTASTSCVGYSTVSVAVTIVTYYTSTSNPTSAQGSDGDIWLVTA